MRKKTKFRKKKQKKKKFGQNQNFSKNSIVHLSKLAKIQKNLQYHCEYYKQNNIVSYTYMRLAFLKKKIGIYVRFLIFDYYLMNAHTLKRIQKNEK